MSDPAIAVGAWWSIAKANPYVLGGVVVLVMLAAIAFVSVRVVTRRRG